MAGINIPGISQKAKPRSKFGIDPEVIAAAVRKQKESEAANKEKAAAKKKKLAAEKSMREKAAAELGLDRGASSADIKFARQKKAIEDKRTAEAEAKALAEKQAAEANAAAEAEARRKAGEASIAGVKAERQELGRGLTSAADRLNLGKFGFGEGDLAQSAALRQRIFEQQQAALQGKQGTLQRQQQEALQRRLAQSGLRGSGTAERLAQVSERQFSGQAGEQLSGLRLGQSQQELAALDQERSQKAQLQQFIEQSQTRARELATQLETSGVDAERARQFSSDQAERARTFQEYVVLKMQSSQFWQQFDESIRQFEAQMKQRNEEFDFDKQVTKFNMDLARAEQNKGGIFDQIKGLFGGGGTGSTLGAVAGGVAGGVFGGPWGAAGGSVAGGQVGGAIDRAFGG